MRANEFINLKELDKQLDETATVGATSAGSIAKELFERISLSKYKVDIDAAFKEACHLTLMDLAYKQTYGHLTSNEFLKYKVEPRLEQRLKESLKTYINDILSDSKTFIGFRFEDLKVSGHAETPPPAIVINKSIIKIISSDLYTQLLSYLSDESVFSYDETTNTTEISDQDYLIRNIRSFVYNPSYGIRDEISETINTIIHEMVHIQQFITQSGRDDYEYRSYLSKKSQFHAAMDRINKGKSTEDDKRLYYASPQEISAHAHNTALEIISLTSYDSTSNPQGALANLDELLQSNEWLRASPRVERYLTTYDKNNPKEYRVYKRFIKSVAQELFAYRQRLLDEIKQIDKNDENNE